MTDEYPNALQSRFTGETGVNRLSSLFNDEMKWIFRRVDQKDDFGIDAYVDIVNEDGSVTGQTIAMQIKHGASYFQTESGACWTYYGERKHLNYYHNIPVPVLLILSHPDGRIFWRRFSAHDVEPTLTGWKLDISKASHLSPDSKAEILKLIGAADNVLARMNGDWKIADQIANSALLFYCIDDASLRRTDISKFVAFIDRVLATKPLAKSILGKLEIYTKAYDDDAHELWEIRDVQRWVRKADDHGIPWFFLCSTKSRAGWLHLYTFVMLDGKKDSVAILDGRAGYKIKIDGSKFDELLGRNLARLFETANRLNLPEPDSIKRGDLVSRFLAGALLQ